MLISMQIAALSISLSLPILSLSFPLIHTHFLCSVITVQSVNMEILTYSSYAFYMNALHFKSHSNACSNQACCQNRKHQRNNNNNKNICKYESHMRTRLRSLMPVKFVLLKTHNKYLLEKCRECRQLSSFDRSILICTSSHLNWHTRMYCAA